MEPFPETAVNELPRLPPAGPPSRPKFPGLDDQRLEEIARRARATLAGLASYLPQPGAIQSVTILSSSLILDLEDLLTLVTEVRRLRQADHGERGAPRRAGLTAPDNRE
jgi:hypothetical protein